MAQSTYGRSYDIRNHKVLKINNNTLVEFNFLVAGFLIFVVNSTFTTKMGFHRKIKNNNEELYNYCYQSATILAVYSFCAEVNFNRYMPGARFPFERI
jgi:hypothetical protein